MAADRLTGKPFATRSEVIAKTGMAATSHPLATQVAVQTLQKGGSAVDAAIAANAVLCLVEPTGCGVGGDLFAIVWNQAEKKLHGLNASGRSPQHLTLQMLQDKGLTKIPAYGPLPVSVPGCVDGWCELHGKFGKLPLEQVLAPAIEYAMAGAPITEVIAYYWSGGVKTFKDYPGFSDVFMPNGRAPVKGELFRNPMLAKTLSRIAASGRNGFYTGHVADTVGKFIAEQGGYLSAKDFSDHRSEWVDPVSLDYRGYKVWELPPNGQGIAALQILGIMENFDVAGMGFGSTEHVHAFIEAKKLAFEDRAHFYADMKFANVPVDKLVSSNYAKKRFAQIDMSRAAKSYDAGTELIESGDTIYLTVADKDRNMVSFIQSNFRGFGSGMCPPGLGFCLQDRGELFSLDPNHANKFEPGKRPFHTIIPAFITKDGKPFMSFGVMGGAMQPQGHAQIVMNVVDFGMNLQEAGDAPRIRHTRSSQPTGESMTDGGSVHLESEFPAVTVRELLKRGHKIEPSVGGYGGYQAIRYDAELDVYFGASESRKDGMASGY
ncbi:MAG: gamma-glutamyltransferase [Planctomycetales bacterium]|nr:gamma-glutamyltransferase [Planctomycetales bacterium]